MDAQEAFQKLLETTEALGLSEGEYLKVTGALKKAYDSLPSGKRIRSYQPRVVLEATGCDTGKDIRIEPVRIVQTEHLGERPAKDTLVTLQIHTGEITNDVTVGWCGYRDWVHTLHPIIDRLLRVHMPSRIKIRCPLTEFECDAMEYAIAQRKRAIQQNELDKAAYPEEHDDDELDGDHTDVTHALRSLAKDWVRLVEGEFNDYIDGRG